MIKCIAVDDEPLALELIESYINKIPFLELVGGFTNAFDALKALQQTPVDLLFLDIQMPDITGLEIASTIDTFRTKVIFTTAFDSYALEGFRVDAIDYMLKPISYTDFLKSARKALRLIENTPDNSSNTLLVRADYRLMKIDYDDILYIEALRDYVGIYLKDGREIKTQSTLKGLESTLSQPFCRVHRSFIVNISKVNVMERNCIVFGKKLIPISEAYRSEVMPRLNMH